MKKKTLTDILLAGKRDVLSQFLDKQGRLAVVLLDQEEKIMGCNEGFMRLLNLTEIPDGTGMQAYLLPENEDVFKTMKTGSWLDTAMSLSPVNTTPVTLHCCIFYDGENYILFGEHLMATNDGVLNKMTVLTNELANVTKDLHRKNRALEEAHEKIKILSGIIPICSSCQKIRDDKGYWQQVAEYISKHSEAEFTHGMCPDCAEKYYSDYM